MTRLFSYRLRFDAGAAPNIYWGICTLAICKPVIRKVATLGDWVVGTGSSIASIGDISDKVIYAMRVTDKKTMKGIAIPTRGLRRSSRGGYRSYIPRL